MNILDRFHIRCRCNSCGKNQVVKIGHYLEQGKCICGSLMRPCNGTLEPISNDPEDAYTNAINVLNFIRHSPHIKDEKVKATIDIVCVDLDEWTSQHETPQSMGWVDSKGRP